MEREKIELTKEELNDFDYTSGYKSTTWELRGETYNFVEKIRTDQFSDGPSWDIVVKRQSDEKFFKWNCWDSGREYLMEDGDNYMKEVFQEVVTVAKYV